MDPSLHTMGEHGIDGHLSLLRCIQKLVMYIRGRSLWINLLIEHWFYIIIIRRWHLRVCVIRLKCNHIGIAQRRFRAIVIVGSIALIQFG